jgi:hypothetical protein
MAATITTKWQDLLAHPTGTFFFPFVCTTDDGSLISLSSATARVVVREHLNDAVETKIWVSTGGTPPITFDVANGIVNLTVPPNIQVPTPGRYIYALEVTLNDGSVIIPWQGRFILERVAAQ